MARVLLISGPATGGIRRHLETLVRSLPDHGFDVAVAAPPQVILPASVTRRDLGLTDRFRPGANIRAVLDLRCALREYCPDLVHAHGLKAAMLCLSVPGARVPVVVTFHNLCRGGLFRAALGPVLRRAAAVVAVSEAVKGSLQGSGRRALAIRVIPNGVDAAAYTPPPPQALSSPFTAAFVGRLTEEKGVIVLLEAARLFSNPPVRLLIAGDGPLKALVAAEAGRETSPLEYLGYRSEPVPLYQAADVLLVPSLAEGQGLAALEAMACGLPVIASRVGGLPEIVLDGETGILVPAKDARALAAAVQRLAADPAAARRMGAAGRARVEAAFTQTAMLAELTRLYRSVLARR